MKKKEISKHLNPNMQQDILELKIRNSAFEVYFEQECGVGDTKGMQKMFSELSHKGVDVSKILRQRKDKEIEWW